MRFRSLPTTVLLALVVTPAFIFAQVSSKEEERLEQLVRSEAEWYAPKSSVTVGFHVLTNGGNVRFGNLGTVPYSTQVAAASEGAVSRVYDNGSVSLDAARAAEMDSFGNQTSTPGGRYQTYGTTTTNVTDASGNVTGSVSTSVVTGDYLSYTPGLTRVWSYATAEQQQAAATSGYIAMNSYRATSEGDALSKKQGASAGVELQFSHVLRKLTKRLELSFVAGIALNGINNKTAGDVHSSLITLTDYYSLNGQPVPALPADAAYVGPVYDSTTDTTLTKETTTPISTTPDPTVAGGVRETTTVGAATVHGRWQVKGAYFMMRVGPMLRAQVTDHLGLTASLGLAGAYAGTHYTAEETLDIPNMTTATTVNEYSDTNKFVSGYYADLNMEWTANDTMGLFGGVSAQKLGDYNQTLNTRTARVDLGNSVGLRGGVSIKF